MRGKRRRSRVAGALTGLLGFACALMLGALFYGTMVYQLDGEEKAAASQAQIQPDTPRQDAQAADAFPGAVLALGEGKLTEERTAEETVEGVRYTDRQAFSVQFHPEACGGPRETSYLFDDFLTMVREGKAKEGENNA